MPERQRGAAALLLRAITMIAMDIGAQLTAGPLPWYEFAAELGNIEAYDAHAEAILSAANLEVLKDAAATDSHQHCKQRRAKAR